MITEYYGDYMDTEIRKVLKSEENPDLENKFLVGDKGFKNISCCEAYIDGQSDGWNAAIDRFHYYFAYKD